MPCAALPEASGTNFILKVDTRSLPTGYRITTENPRVMRLTRGIMTEMNFGASISRIVRVDINSRGFTLNDAGEFVLTDQFARSLIGFLDQVNESPSSLRIAFHLPRNANAAQRATARQMMRVVADAIDDRWDRIGNYRLRIERTYVAEE